MGEALDSFAKENGVTPEEVQAYFRNTYSSLIGPIETANTAGEAVEIFQAWVKDFKQKEEPNESFLELLRALLHSEVISEKGYRALVLCLSYAADHKVVELDYSGYVELKEGVDSLKDLPN